MKMLFVVETIEGSEKKYNVVESDSPKRAMLQDGFDLLNSESDPNTKIESSEVHRFYRERIKNLGFDSTTFKKIE
jgi:hypothetical protein